MSDGELTRLLVLRDLDQRRLATAAAAQLLGLERRQVYRLLKVCRTEGPTGDFEATRSPSNRRKPEAPSEKRAEFARLLRLDRDLLDRFAVHSRNIGSQPFEHRTNQRRATAAGSEVRFQQGVSALLVNRKLAPVFEQGGAFHLEQIIDGAATRLTSNSAGSSSTPELSVARSAGRFESYDNNGRDRVCQPRQWHSSLFGSSDAPGRGDCPARAPDVQPAMRATPISARRGRDRRIAAVSSRHAFRLHLLQQHRKFA